MNISRTLKKYLEEEIEFLGFVIGRDGIKTNPKKVQAIAPKNPKDLRSFLGMSGYYRRFIRDYAKLAKPLTILLRGEDGRVSKSFSKNKTIIWTKRLWNHLIKEKKNSLVFAEIILTYPNFEKEFELTTDASDYAIAAVLSRENKPITFLSRTLNKTEENYATNEKEKLAIIW